MLSQEIYESWNAKTLTDLKDLLDNITTPSIPKDVKSTTFKQAVLKRIEKRRLADRRKSFERDYELWDEEHTKRGCCSCCRCKKTNRKPLRAIEIKSFQSFVTICEAATSRFSTSISSVKALIQKLSYWESIKPGTDGLSVIGGYIWLLSYTCQHLIDGPGQSKEGFRMQVHISDVKELYQELAQAGELFLDMQESFHESVYNMRMDGLLVLKRLTKRWKIGDDYNPLMIRTEHVRLVPRPRKRLGAGLDSPVDTEDEDDVFSVKWSPLVVFVKIKPDEKAKPFGKLHPQDRITIFRKFLKHTLSKVEMDAEDLTVIGNSVDSIEVKIDSDNGTYSGRELTAALLQFTKSKHCPKSLAEKESKKIVLLLNEFWYSLDVFYENVFILMRLVQETRDIIRTCYVYTDIFYKWYMPSYDRFMSINKQKGRESVTSNAKEFLTRFSNSSEKKLSETTSILTLMDFSSSIYQGVVQEIPVECEGMSLRLRVNDLEYNQEPMGLVSGIVDKRKSVMGLMR